MHFFEDGIHLFLEITFRQLSVLSAPAVAFYFGDFYFRFFQRIEDFGRASVYEFCSEFNGYVAKFITERKNTATETVARFENLHRNTGTSEFASCREPGHTCADDDDCWIFRHSIHATAGICRS